MSDRGSRIYKNVDRRVGNRRRSRNGDKIFGERRKSSRRIADRAVKYREEFLREQECGKLRLSLKKHIEVKKGNLLFAFKQQQTNKKIAAEIENNKNIEGVREQKRLAKHISMSYGLDQSVPAATRLIQWPEDIKKRKVFRDKKRVRPRNRI